MGSRFPRNSTTRVRVRAQDGFTLIELMVSALIITLIAAGVAQALIGSTHFSGDQRFRAQADEVAQQDQERLKGMSDQQLDSLTQTRTVTLSGTQFTVRSTATFVDATGGSSCSSGTAAYYKLTSTAGWTEGSRTPSITEEAVVARAVTGAILQKVQDQTGAPLPGASVSVDGQNTSYDASAVTDANGCTVITGLPTDSYAITLAYPGYVDWNGNASPPNASAAVSQTNVATPPAQTLGSAGSITASFQTGAATNSALAVPGYELSYYGKLGGAEMTTYKTVGSATTPATTWSPTSLFPFYSQTAGYQGNYQLWAGKCQGEQPLVPPTNTDTATVSPGAGASATVLEPAIDATFGGATPTHVHITYTNSAGTCSDTWNVAAVGTETVNGTTYSIYPAPFATTAAQGTPTASATGETGTITFCADLRSGARYRVQSQSPMTTTNFSAPNYSLNWNLSSAPTSATPCP